MKKGKINGTLKYNGNTVLQIVEDQDQKKTATPETEEQKEFTVEGTYTSDPFLPVFDVVEEMPQFPGGASALLEFLSKNIRYPKEAFDANKGGRVIASFVIETDGSISEVKVVKSVEPSLDEEAIRVINAMPNWTPGKQSGKAVRVKYTVPINFRLDGSKPKDNNIAKDVYLMTSDPAKTPLIIVDGKEMPYENLKIIASDDVESVSVLKDQAAVSTYGEKAKDGVIIFTLKKK